MTEEVQEVTVSNLMEYLQEEDQKCRDINCFMGDLGVDDRGRLTVAVDDGFEVFPINDWATGQMCSKLGIPKGYYDKCPAHLRSQNVAHWVSTDRFMGKSAFVRLKKQTKYAPELDKFGNNVLDDRGNPVMKADGIEERCRGILTDKYSTLQNARMVEMVHDALWKEYREDVKIDQFWDDDLSFHMRVLFPNLKDHVRTAEDQMIGGLHFGNSEVGFRRVTVDLLVWRQVCSNGLIGLRSGESWFSEKHMGKSEVDLRHAILNVVRESADQVRSMFGNLKDLASSDAIPEKDLDQAIEVVGKGLKKDFLEIVKTEVVREGDFTQYGLLNAFTASARTLRGDDRLFVEQTVAHRMLRAA